MQTHPSSPTLSGKTHDETKAPPDGDSLPDINALIQLAYHIDHCMQRLGHRVYELGPIKSRFGAPLVNESDIWKDEPEKSVRKTILMTALKYVTKDRATKHGAPEDSFAIIASYWQTYLNSIGKRDLTGSDVSAMMILLKTARISNNPQHADNWIDVAGYAACGGEIAGIPNA